MSISVVQDESELEEAMPSPVINNTNTNTNVYILSSGAATTYFVPYYSGS